MSQSLINIIKLFYLCCKFDVAILQQKQTTVAAIFQIEIQNVTIRSDLLNHIQLHLPSHDSASLHSPFLAVMTLLANY